MHRRLMGYDYSIDFLRRNSALVRQLQEIAASDEIRAATYDSPEELQRARLVVNNVLASLEVNYPDQFRDIRKTLRTWTDRQENGKWRLFIGIPKHRVAGRRPGGSQVVAPDHFKAVYGPARTIEPAVIDYGRVIGSTPEDLAKFRAWVGNKALSPDPQVLIATFESEVDGMAIDAFNEVFGNIGWRAAATSAHTVEIRRGRVAGEQLVRGRPNETDEDRALNERIRREIDAMRRGEP